MEPVIRMEGVGKRYRLGKTGYDHQVLSQRLEKLVRTPFRKLRGGDAAVDNTSEGEEFWALRDLSLEVAHGEILGIIGANGSGKSTMLKLLSQITPPTEGRIEIEGRVRTLLEVGTGFHPDLTGRENVYLNGVLLGMRKAEIAAKFDEIVEFSGVEKFLDTPVKRYSSGMYVRLAFSVAAHLESDILLIDEVLAVGDAEFQAKCLGKMDEAARSGRTVVFVSHALSTVQRLCSRAIWMQKGHLSADGTPQDVIATYFERTGARQMGGEVTIPHDAHRVGTGEVRLVRAEMVDEEGRQIEEQLRIGQPWTLRMSFDVLEPATDVIVYAGLSAADSTRVISALSVDGGQGPVDLQPGRWEVEVDFEAALLPGDFSIDIAVNEADRKAIDQIDRALTFTAVNVGYGDEPAYPWPVTLGYVRPRARWSVPTSTDSEAMRVG